MNKAAKEARELFEEITRVKFDQDKTEVVVIPPSVYLSWFSPAINKQSLNIRLGAQNSYPKDEGAFTGEVSAYILNSLGVTYCLVGHSERRKYFGETDGQCNEKLKALLGHQICPVLCVGEELELRETGKHFDHVKKQLEQGLSGLNTEEIGNTVIAYEPVWAIGTGKTATTQQASEMHTFIRQFIEKTFDYNTAAQVRILYGGSVTETNAKELMSASDIDGVLVGGASLKIDSFRKIIAAAE